MRVQKQNDKSDSKIVKSEDKLLLETGDVK